MCGFVGSLFEIQAKNQRSITSMLKVIHHRGPDDTGVYMDNDIQLGFQRLSIIDLEKGHQPLSYEDGRYWIVFNGEIYNYLELREKLLVEGFVFQTESDTEVIVALYSKYKEKCVKLLEGMFSFVIWDSHDKELFGARDPFGIKPFYYLEQEESFSFSSEFKSLLELLPVSINDDVQYDQLQHYLSFQYVPEPQTICSSVKKLPPGYYFYKQLGEKMKVKEYWHPTFFPIFQSEKGLKGLVQSTLRKSVEQQMRSDVPVGCFLSGGIDSTIIATLAKEQHSKIRTFSVGFDVNGYSEIEIAEKTAEKLKLENDSYIITAEEFSKELPKIIWHLDDPVADPAAVPLYFLAREARKHVKVALSGEGADELFGGYNIYREPRSLRAFSLIPPFIQDVIRAIGKELPEGMKGRGFLLRGCTPIEERFIGNAKIFSEEEKSLFYKKYQKELSTIQITGKMYQEAAEYDEIAKMQYVDMLTWLRGDILVKADRMSMAHSLEVRVPFLSKEVFDIASSLGPHLKISSTSTKYLLRKSVEDLIPAHVVNRKKLGFPVPIRVWLKNELYEWAYMIFKNSTTATEYFHVSYLLKLLEDHRIGKRDNSRKLWTVIVFLVWHNMYVEQYQCINSVSKKDWLEEDNEKMEEEKEA
ncbi:asparagine synthase (glutamine-hydrolyzing) [Sutcliffiella halmapala]|uniref:asparagine synthase (glutamine-hydrolyzing) n=1 Tax=Sutcliffiella halmapala TaxID=79882 RepID=UPI0009959402|nr:asparagine synthase (glutamine-hydrolyzing) [Sutcliffiella halmapala]